ncbi:MAG: PAS domain S-box protein [Candidatus Dadabacteria bacterium]|nr:PAS domain S-box protein [Candidatus Dadabacteria bacterium]NIV41772.1 PAS domain S-box protein [Candidatus Dadabacteria bacterium]NIX14659.1 PAS domain S-box protein [Candidatus Dadabacteria bacterium]
METLIEDSDKTRHELVKEIEVLKNRVSDLEKVKPDNQQSDSALVKSEEKYRSLFENSPSMFFTVKADGNIAEVNEFGCKELGYASDELIGKPVINIFHPLDRETVSKQLQMCFDNPGKFFDWEFRKIKKDGETIWVRETARSFHAKDEGLLALIDCRDISVLKQAEKQLNQTVEKLRVKTKYEELINSISQVIHRSINLNDVLDNTVHAIRGSIDIIDKVSIYFVEGNNAVLKAHSGVPSWYIEKTQTIPFDDGYTWNTIATGKPAYSSDTDNDKLVGPAEILLGIKSYVSVPIKFDNNIVGAINAASFSKDVFREEDISLLGLVANQISMVIENGRQSEQLQQTYNILEERVKERTLELLKSNALLREEIEKRIRAEVEIKKSLQEKEILLKEVQHRVKNNLQVISSMLDLQTDYVKDSGVSEMFIEAQKRVKSMALVHEQMYQSEILTDLDFSQYIENLGNYLFTIYGVNTKVITLETKIEEVNIDFNRAILLGLIVNELISNSLKYAFSEDQKGYVRVRLDTEDDCYILTTSDNGKGLPKNFRLRQTKSLGLQLVQALTNQLKGSIKIDRRKGTKFTIRFPK